MRQSRTLVVYFSLSGTTRKLAKIIAKELSADEEEVVDLTPRQGFLGYCRSLIEARWQLPPKIALAKHIPSSYDLVVIGTPVWAWSVSSPVRAYLLAHKASPPNVAFFCTMGSSGAERAIEQLRQLTGKVPRAVLAVTARDVDTNNYAQSLIEFLKAAASTLSGAENRQR